MFGFLLSSRRTMLNVAAHLRVFLKTEKVCYVCKYDLFTNELMYVFIDVCVCMYLCMYVCMYLCIYVCKYVSKYIHISIICM